MEHGVIDAGALARWLDVPDVVLEGAPTGGGWSNETVFVRAGPRALVLRLVPDGRSMFPAYDLGHQVRALSLAAGAGLPVPELVGYEPDPTVLGRPFFVMVRVAGRVPADDDPPFTRAGFLFEAPAAEQRRFHDNAVDAIAAVHRVAAPPFATVGPELGRHLDWCRELVGWCGIEPEVLGAAHGLLAPAVPTVEGARHGLLWGDARPANMVLDERLAVVALLDWELAASGPGELDVAWFCEMNHMRSTGTGIAPLPGLPSEEVTWDRWAAALGRRPEHLDWHRLFAAYRVAVFLQLYLATMVARGLIPAGHRVLHDNPGTRRLSQLLA